MRNSGDGLRLMRATCPASARSPTGGSSFSGASASGHDGLSARVASAVQLANCVAAVVLLTDDDGHILLRRSNEADNEAEQRETMSCEPRVQTIIPDATAPRHIAIVRITHWIAVLSVLGLLASGIGILVSHPRLYWGETGAVGTPSLIDLPIPFIIGPSVWNRPHA